MNICWKPAALLLMAALLAGVLAGCSATGEIKTYTDTSQTINVPADHEFIIQAVGNPTGGPDWQPSFDPSTVTMLEKSYQNNPAGGKTGAAGGVENFRFKALRKGQTKITLVLMASPKTLIPLGQFQEYQVTIN